MRSTRRLVVMTAMSTAAAIGLAGCGDPDTATPAGSNGTTDPVARRGDELLPLTKDYRVGRFTAELDAGGTGTYVVTAVQVELPMRVETVPRQP